MANFTVSPALKDLVKRLRTEGQDKLAMEIANLADTQADNLEASMQRPSNETRPDAFIAKLTSQKIGKPLPPLSRARVTQLLIAVLLFFVFAAGYQFVSVSMRSASVVLGWIPKFLHSEDLQQAAMISVSENPYFFLELSIYLEKEGKTDRARAMAAMGLKMTEGRDMPDARKALEAQLEKL